MRQYIGITIGPIGDTIGDASSPAALWFASGMFSDITRRLCKNIKERFADAQVYSPFYDESKMVDDGVGKYHDRIFFSTEQYADDILKQLIDDVKCGTCEMFPFQEEGMAEFFKEYLQVHYVAVEESEIGEQNCVLVLSPYLDALELMKTFPKNKGQDPLKKLFKGEKGNDNKYVKEKLIANKDSQFIKKVSEKESRIYKIEEIASGRRGAHTEFKKSYYYAVVSADGDGMGKFLQGLSSAEVTGFSECCLEYDTEAAKMIGDFGGMTIYAGGDDLLFLAPVENEKGENVLGLCNRIGTRFREIIASKPQFSGNEYIPTISFGVSIQYYKYPLYEALGQAGTLLQLAKKDGDFANEDCQKNNIMLNVQKHSGQSLAVLIGNEAYSAFEALLHCKDGDLKGTGTKAEHATIQSVLYILGTFKNLLFVLNEKARSSGTENMESNYKAYEAAWLNLFDNAGQQKAEGYIKKVCKKYYDYLLIGSERIQAPSDGEKDEYNKDISLKTLLAILKYRKFLEEKGGEDR